MARHPSLLKLAADSGRSAAGIRPETTMAMDVLSAVEQRYGLERKLGAALSVYATIAATRGVHDQAWLDDALDLLDDTATRVRNTVAAMRAGAAPQDAILTTVHVIGEPEGNA